MSDDDDGFGDEWGDSDPGTNDDDVPAPVPGTPSRKRGRPAGKGQAKAKAKAKTQASAKSGDKLCFVINCGSSKKANSRFCEAHRQAADNIKTQAVANGTPEYAEQILYDAVKCTAAIEQWMKENPPGRFRKQLIDWTVWSRMFDVKTRITIRTGFTAWNWTDWSDEHSHWKPERVLAKWNQYKNDPKIEREGTGDDMELWIPDKKRKMQDEVKEITQRVAEGSKQMKALKAMDKNNLQNFAHLSQASFTDKFFKEDRCLCLQYAYA